MTKTIRDMYLYYAQTGEVKLNMISFVYGRMQAK